jgi:hypothetical protein
MTPPREAQGEAKSRSVNHPQNGFSCGVLMLAICVDNT